MRRLLSALLLAVGAASAFGAFGGCSSDDAGGASADGGGDTAASVDGAACTIEQVKCGDQCVVLASNHDNCGTCGAACGDGQACRAGTCAACLELNLDTCGTQCADLATDNAHCGACEKACPTGQVCANGRCDVVCADAGVACGPSCVDVQTDTANCGTCGNACSTGQACTAGVCECADKNLVACGATCIDPNTDKGHCGATAGCGTTAGFVGEKCLTSGYCQSAACQLCQSWTQGATLVLGLDSNTVRLAVRDFNGDGKLDIAVLDYAAGKLHMYIGKGDGTFAVGAVVTEGASPQEMRVGDFNGDSKLDIAFVNFEPTANRYVTILAGKGDGTFTAGPIINHVVPATAIAVGDINGDGRLDLVVGGGDGAGGADVHTYIQKVDHTFARGTTDYSTIFLNAFGAPYGPMDLTDVDKDGKLDLVVNAGATGVLYGDGAGGFTVGWASSPFGTGGLTLLVADVNTDGKPDLVIGSQSGTGLTLFPNAGGRGFGASSTVRFPDESATRLVDVTGDGVLDLVATEGDAPATFAVRAGKGDGTFLPAVSFPYDTSAPGYRDLAFGDLNGDGRLDVAGITDIGVRVLLGVKSTAAGCP